MAFGKIYYPMTANSHHFYAQRRTSNKSKLDPDKNMGIRNPTKKATITEKAKKQISCYHS